MDEVKYQHIKNEIVRKKFFDIPNIKKKIATLQLTFIGKVTSNYNDHLTTKLLTTWYNHKRRRGGVLHTNKKYIIHNLQLIISGVDKNRALKTWAHFDIDERYRQHLISGLGTSLASTLPRPEIKCRQYL